MRIQKYLSQAGIASRREVERWIDAGRLQVNGRKAQLGQTVSASDKIQLDGNPLSITGLRETEVLLYHKPVGEVVSRRDEEGRKTIFEQLPKPNSGRWIAVGRLDIQTSGLLVLTNDGEQANRWMHPRYACKRVYDVRVRGELTEESLRAIKAGVPLEDGIVRCTAFEKLQTRGQNSWYRLTLQEGRNRVVRRLFQALNYPISRLIRVQFGPFQLSRDLRPGQSQKVHFKSTDF